MDTERSIKAFFAIGLTIIASLPLIISPVSSYEPSIYSGFPIWYWLVMGFTLCGVLICLLFHLHWQIALVTGLSLHVVYLALPLLRGYYLYGRGQADVLAHIGYAVDIQQSGSVDIFGHNFYPLLHLLMVSITSISGVDLRVSTMILSIVFTPLFIIGVFIYSKRIFNRRKAVTVLAFTMPLSFGIFHHSVHSSILSFFLLPLVLWFFEIYNRKVNDRYAIVIGFFILIFAIVVFHPMTSILVVIAITAATIYYTPWIPATNLSSSKPTTLFLLPGVLFSAWYLSLPRTLGTISSFILFLIQGGKTTATEQTTYASETPLTGLEFILRFLDLYGLVFLLAMIASIATLYYFYIAIINKRIGQEIFINIQFIIGVTLAIGLLFGFLFTISPIRAARYMIFFSIITCGIFVFTVKTSQQMQTQSTLTILLILVIIITVPMSLSSYEHNAHLTQTEVEGTEWVEEASDSSFSVQSHMMGPKMTMYLYGHEYGRDNSVFMWGENTVPDELGYKNNHSLDSVYENDSYLILKDHDMRYHKPYPDEQSSQLKLYKEDNLNQLENDPNANNIYSNSGYNVWSIKQSN